MQNKYLEKHTDINKGFGFLIINNVQMVNMARKLLGLSDKLVNGSKNEGLTLICKETECMVVSKKKKKNEWVQRINYNSDIAKWSRGNNLARVLTNDWKCGKKYRDTFAQRKKPSKS